MAANMLHSVKTNIKAQYGVKSNTQLEMYIFGQVTKKQRRFETFDTTKIYYAAFEIVPYSNNSLTEEMFTNIQTRKVQKQFVIMFVILVIYLLYSSIASQ